MSTPASSADASRALEKTPALVFVVAVAVVALQLATGWRYGLFRDEFYYLACADHLDWGYVDHPPLSIAVLAAVRAVLGDSLLAVRLVPSLLMGLLVWLTSRLARELGGGRFAQGFAALSVAIVPEYLGITGFYSMNAFDLVFWTLAALIVARLVRTDDARLWRPLGLVIGLGLLNKLSPLFFAFGLAVAVLLTPLRRHLRRRELWQGTLLAGLIFVPYVVWELRHDWATLEFMRNATRYKNVGLSPLQFLKVQIPELNPFNAPIWLAGLAALLAGPVLRRFRALGIIFVAVFAVLAAQNSKAYYLAGAFPMLLAAGALVFEGLSSGRRWRWTRPVLAVVLVGAGALVAPLAIPVLPVERLIAYQRALGVTPTAAERSGLGPLSQHLADRFGWHELTAEVARIHASLPAQERATAVILTNNYGEAGALQYYGRSYHLPLVISQHNNYYLWGPGNGLAAVWIVVGRATDDLRGSFEQVEIAGQVESPYAMPFETRRPIHVCRGLKVPLDAAWREGKLYI